MNLHGRSLLKEIDFTKDEFVSLIDLAAQLRRRKRTGTERQRLAGRNIALIFEKASTRTRAAFEVAAHDQGAHVTYLGPEGVPHRAARRRSRTRPGCSAGCSTASSTAASPKSPSRPWPRIAGVPVWNGLTDQWHPTQMLADILTMRDHSDKPLDRGRRTATWATPATTRPTRCWSPAPCSAWTCGSPRPRTLWPAAEVQAIAAKLAAASGRPDQRHRRRRRRRSRAPTSSTPTSGCPWASPTASGTTRIELLLPYQVNADVMTATGNPAVKFMHCLRRCTTATPTSASRSTTSAAWTALEVTDEVFESPASDRLRPGREPAAHHQGGHGRHARATEHAHRRRRSAATPCSSAGEVPAAEIQEKHVRAAVDALAPLAADHDLVITHGNGPQVGLLALRAPPTRPLPHPYPFDVLGAQTQGMIGYWLLQALENALPGRQVVSLITQTLVDRRRPGLRAPDQVRRAVYTEDEGQRAGRPPRLACRGRTAPPGGGWWPRPSRRRSSSSPTIRRCWPTPAPS